MSCVRMMDKLSLKRCFGIPGFKLMPTPLLSCSWTLFGGGGGCFCFRNPEGEGYLLQVSTDVVSHVCCVLYGVM